MGLDRELGGRGIERLLYDVNCDAKLDCAPCLVSWPRCMVWAGASLCEYDAVDNSGAIRARRSLQRNEKIACDFLDALILPNGPNDHGLSRPDRLARFVSE